MAFKKRLIAIFVSLIVVASITVPVAATTLTLGGAGITYGYYNTYMCKRAYATFTAGGGGTASFKVVWIIGGSDSWASETYINSGETETGYSYYVDKSTNYNYRIRMYQR